MKDCALLRKLTTTVNDLKEKNKELTQNESLFKHKEKDFDNFIRNLQEKCDNIKKKQWI